MLALVVGWPLGLFGRLAPETFMALALAAAAALSIRGMRGVGAVAALVALGLLGLMQPVFQLKIVHPDAEMLGLAAMALMAVAVATWRAMGPALPCALAALVFFVLAIGPELPERFATRPVDAARVAAYLAYDSNGLLSRMLYIAAATIAPFVLFGGLFVATGAGRVLTAPLQRMLAGCQGGSAKAAVLGSAVFGMVSGSAVANVATSGPLTIPMMVRDGAPPHEAAAIEAVASTNGQLTPPVMGASAFLMAEWLGLPYADVALAAAAPAALAFVALIMVIDFRARAGSGARATPSHAHAGTAQAQTTVAEFLLALAPFATLACALFVGGASPGRAALLGCATLAALHLAATIREGLGPAARTLAAGALASAPAIAGILLLAASAALIMGLLNVSGAGFMLTVRLLDIAGGAFVPVATLSAALALVLGLGMPTVGVYLVGASLCAPALIAAGAEPLAAHLFILSAGMLSMISPPVALASFAAAMIAEAAPWRTAFAAMRLASGPVVVAAMMLIQPALLDPFAGLDFVGAVVACAVALALLAAAHVGHVGAPVGSAARAGALALALAVLSGAGAGPADAGWIAAVLAGLSFLAWHTPAGQRIGRRMTRQH